MNFEYAVRDSLGRSVEGTIEAVSMDEARQSLRRDGFNVVDLHEAEAGGGFSLRGVSRQELIYATAQLAVMVDTGITLSAALSGIVEQEENPKLRRILRELKEKVEAGEDFSEALAEYPNLFDKTYVALVKASEATGSLGPMLERIGAYLRKELETRNKVRAAMAYPAIMMVAACGVTAFLITYILPKFMPIFKARGSDLPGPTVLLMSVSDAFTDYWQFWLVGIVIVVGGLIWGKRTPEGRRYLDWVKINAPIIGTLCRKISISRGIRTLGALLGAGVPVMDSLRLASAVSGNVYYESLWQNVLEEVSSGKRICEILHDSPLFPRVLTQMISAGEEAGKLDVVLEKISNFYDSEVETSIKTVSGLIEPIMIAAMGVVIGTIGLALMLPIFSLSRQP